MDIAVVDDERVVLEQICGLIEKQMPDCYLESYATGEGRLGEEGGLISFFLIYGWMHSITC